MWRSIRRLAGSFSLASLRQAFKGTNKREFQEQIDTHRLFLYTSLHAQRQQSPGGLPEGFAEEIIAKAEALPFSEQKAVVQKHLCTQLLQQANIIHGELLQAGDPAEAAQAFIRAHLQHDRPVFTQDTTAAGSGMSDAAANSMSHSSMPSNTGLMDSSLGTGTSGSSTSRMRIGQQELSQRVGACLGFHLQVRRSNIEHEEAGLGLFVAEGGEVPPGALVALFPGLVYSRSVYRRMPNYPKVDRDNPYLIARYDGRIIDSRPWGRGALPPPLDPQSQVLARDEGLAPSQHIRRRGVVGRIVAASDGPRSPIPTVQWVQPTTAEAAQLERLLEGRHPLALAHFANHPAPGIAPNTMVASFRWRAGDGGFAGCRAYMPVMDYAMDATPKDLLQEDVHGIGLVALRALSGGEEILFNYRLSPGLLGRPHWYTPVNELEEDRRWS